MRTGVILTLLSAALGAMALDGCGRSPPPRKKPAAKNKKAPPGAPGPGRSLTWPIVVAGRAGRTVEVVAADTPLPYEWSGTFTNDEDNQESLPTLLAQKRGERIVSLDIALSGIPRRPKFALTIRARFRIGADKMLSVAAESEEEGWRRTFGPYRLDG